MEVIDYNGEGRWARIAILQRYAQYAAKAGTVLRDLSPMESTEGNRHRIYPVMTQVISGIEAGDPACIRIGIEFIEEDAKFPFGKILKSNTARALRRASLTEPQRRRIRTCILGMLKSGKVPHEFREYAKLVRKIGIRASDLPDILGTSQRVARFRSYLLAAACSDRLHDELDRRIAADDADKTLPQDWGELREKLLRGEI